MNMSCKEFNEKMRSERFSKAALSYDAHASIQRTIGAELYRSMIGKLFQKRVLDVGCGTGVFSSLLLQEKPSELTLCDFSSGMLAAAQRRFLHEKNVNFKLADCEHDNLGIGYDVIVSNAAVQWFSSLQDGLLNIKKALAASGLMAFSTFVSGNMREINELCACSLDYLTCEQLQASVSSIFKHVELKTFSLCSYYKNVREMLASLRATGVTGTSSSVWTKKHLLDFERCYEAKFSDERGIRLSWECAVVKAHD